MSNDEAEKGANDLYDKLMSKQGKEIKGKYKCNICGYRSETKKEMREHVKKAHIKPVENTKTKHVGIGSIWRLIAGIIVGYVAGGLLIGILGASAGVTGIFFSTMFYVAVVTIGIYSKAKDDDEAALDFLIGMQGLVPGLIQYRILLYKQNASRFTAAYITGLILIFIIVVILIALKV